VHEAPQKKVHMAPSCRASNRAGGRGQSQGTKTWCPGSQLTAIHVDAGVAGCRAGRAPCALHPFGGPHPPAGSEGEAVAVQVHDGADGVVGVTQQAQQEIGRQVPAGVTQNNERSVKAIRCH